MVLFLILIAFFPRTKNKTSDIKIIPTRDVSKKDQKITKYFCEYDVEENVKTASVGKKRNKSPKETTL